MNRDDAPSASYGFVHSVESAGTLDGPGIRFILFLSGCPLRCLYCHNPDTWRMRGGLPRTTADVLEEISSYRDFLRRAKGGVTISGGEPLMQPAFLQAILAGCKRMGLHTALDTSGHLGHMAPDALLHATDLVILDIKAADDARHRGLTGKPLKPTLDFARRLEALGKPTWIRFVLVPGVTDAEENIRGIARLASGLGNVERVEILPFHQMGLYKWRELGLGYALEHTPAASSADVARARRLFAEAGVTAR